MQHGSKVFAYFYGMFNIYVLLLAFCYTPAGSIYGDINTNDNVRALLFCACLSCLATGAPCPTHMSVCVIIPLIGRVTHPIARCSMSVAVCPYWLHEKLEMVAEDQQGVPSYKDDTAFTIVESSNRHTML